MSGQGGMVAARTVGVEHIRVHTRHSAAIGLLEAGVPVTVVVDLLGESSISTMGDIGGHIVGETARAAVDGWSGAVGP